MGVFRMPSLGADMEAGKLVEWLIKPGDSVSRGDVVAVVETQKGAIEIEIFEDGKVHELLAKLGDTLPVGAPLAVILAEGEAPPEPSTAPESEAAAPAEPVPETMKPAPIPTAPAPAAAAGAHEASPAARKRAEALGLDLSTLKGSGPGGRIVYADVGGAGATPPPRLSPQDEMRKAIAAAMTRSKQTIPHYYLSHTMDVEPALRFVEAHNETAPPDERILIGAVFVRAVALAAQKVAVMNGHYSDASGFTPADRVNPGVAIALRGGGLVAPALMGAADMTLQETMAGMRDLVTRARAGRLRSSEMTEGTITVSSVGESGPEAMAAVIFPPQVAIVGIGAPQLRPWIVDGAMAPRRVVTVTVSADHRVSDGRQAARFLAAFEAFVQTPEEL